MIDADNPDFSNTPASDRRPDYGYAPRIHHAPVLSIVTPYFNASPVFWETFRCIQRMSLVYWEWIIVDDETTMSESLAQLEQARHLDSRIRVIRQPNGGPGVARNHAVSTARGTYLMILDSDDMVEPTFAEKAIWFLETQSTMFAAVNSYNITFGSRNFLWTHGFNRGSENIEKNSCTIQSVVRKSAYLAVGGFDERVSYEHADWDFWLTLAESGMWGHTLPEYLTWYRNQERSLVSEIENDRERSMRFREWLHHKHRGLHRRFPRPQLTPAGFVPAAAHHISVPIENPLAKAEHAKGVLFIVSRLDVDGADRLILDAVRQLTERSYKCTIAATTRKHGPWLSRFTTVTPDVFCLHSFLNLADHPRFISYLIDSRQVDAVVIANSEFGYRLLPYLRARHPNVAFLDFNHMEELKTSEAGCHGKSVAVEDLLDIRMTTSKHVKQVMVDKGASAERIDVLGCAMEVFSVGLCKSIDHAVALSAQRAHTPELHATDLAHAVVCHLARQDAREARRLADDDQSIRGRIRQARELVLPIGTRRYEVYKSMRKRLRGDRVS